MNLGNCPRCGNLFNASFRDVCQICSNREEEQYKTVRDYIRKNRQAGMYEVSEKTEIPMDIITKFIKQGRIDISKNSAINYGCEACGNAISQGRICNSCITELHKGISGINEDINIRTRNIEAEKGKHVYHHEELRRK